MGGWKGARGGARGVGPATSVDAYRFRGRGRRVPGGAGAGDLTVHHHDAGVRDRRGAGPVNKGAVPNYAHAGFTLQGCAPWEAAMMTRAVNTMAEWPRWKGANSGR